MLHIALNQSLKSPLCLIAFCLQIKASPALSDVGEQKQFCSIISVQNYVRYIQIMALLNQAEPRISWELTLDDIYVRMLEQSLCQLFSWASCSQRWVIQHQFTDQHLCRSPLALLNTHTHTHTTLCQSVRNKWGEVLYCSAQQWPQPVPSDNLWYCKILHHTFIYLCMGLWL